MIVYPAIDLRQGRVVRLHQGRAEAETVYYDDPAEPARLWKAAGARWVHVVDLDGAFTGQPANQAGVRRILAEGLSVQLGGGLRREETVAEVVSWGVQRVVIGTRAAADPDFISRLVETHGSRVAVGIDARDGWVAVKGWVETACLRALELARQVEALGVQTIIYTDISRDGALTGPNFEAQEEMLQAVNLRVIASGGVASDADLRQFASLAQRYSNLDGVITGKALYEGKIDLPAWNRGRAATAGAGVGQGGGRPLAGND